MHSLKEFASDLRSDATDARRIKETFLITVGKEVQKSAKDLIGHDHPYWPALADGTIEIKRRLGYGLDGNPASPLYATGEFRESIGVKLISENEIEVGTDLPYVKFTEYGTSKMPPRPVFPTAAKNGLKHTEKYVKKMFVQRLKRSRNESNFT